MHHGSTTCIIKNHPKNIHDHILRATCSRQQRFQAVFWPLAAAAGFLNRRNTNPSCLTLISDEFWKERTFFTSLRCDIFPRVRKRKRSFSFRLCVPQHSSSCRPPWLPVSASYFLSQLNEGQAHAHLSELYRTLHNLLQIINVAHFSYLAGWSEFQLHGAAACLMQFRLLQLGGRALPRQVTPETILHKCIAESFISVCICSSSCTSSSFFHRAARDLHFVSTPSLLLHKRPQMLQMRFPNPARGEN